MAFGLGKLAVLESKLDIYEDLSQLIIKMIEEMKATHAKDNEILHERVSALQKKVDTNAKFVIGATAVIATIVTIAQVAAPLLKPLTQQQSSATIQRLVA